MSEARTRGTLPVDLLAVPRDRNQLQVGQSGEPSQCGRQIVPVHHREADVQNCNVGSYLHCRLKRCWGVQRNSRVIPLLRQHGSEQTRGVFVIVHDQDSRQSGECTALSIV